jgi:hypothetical protein
MPILQASLHALLNDIATPNAISTKPLSLTAFLTGPEKSIRALVFLEVIR